MAKNLVIVESPAKARTVGRFLGKDYRAEASMGHVRDLPQKDLGVEITDGRFKPVYKVLPDKRKIVSELARAAKEASTIYLATDPDREGEAISWHLLEASSIDPSKTKRVVFHEITRDAIEEAFRHPRDLDENLIDAQQARRVLDRLVGYKLSPLLWRKVRRGLSAGRVQSVALRLIVDREEEVARFVPVEYWTIDAALTKGSAGFKARLRSVKGKRGTIEMGAEAAAAAILKDLDGAGYSVDLVKKREARSRPAPPFITSTLQQEAARKLRFTARRTMQVAQQLYEGLPLGDEGPTGLITYMRTDSTNVASSALSEAAAYIKRRFGAEYAPKSPRRYKRKVKGAQEAHEAIRPTSIGREPAALRSHLTNEQFRLYDLIWKRMLASQMSDALFDATTVDIAAKCARVDTVYLFRATGSVLKFKGFRTVYMEDRDDADESDQETAPLPDLANGDILECKKLKPEQHFTQPPPRFSEASVIKALEENGIGRPSTYAPIIATILDRDYVRKETGRFVPTKLGTAVTRLLTAHFANIMEVGFTARIEDELDEIANGEKAWEPMLKEFYGPFDEALELAMEKAERVPRDQIDEESDEVCEKCERPMVIKSGRFGRFLSCSGFPECRNSRPLLSRVGVDCPKCGNDLVERRSKGKGKGKGGRLFYGCTGYPACDFATNSRPLPQPCPECGEMLLASGRSNARCSSCDFKGPVPKEEPVEAAV